MDTTTLSIIVISVVLAVVFKWYFYCRIQRWMNEDMIKRLADNNSEKQKMLQQRYQELVQAKFKSKVIEQQLTEYAEQLYES